MLICNGAASVELVLDLPNRGADATGTGTINKQGINIQVADKVVSMSQCDRTGCEVVSYPNIFKNRKFTCTVIQVQSPKLFLQIGQ